MTPAALVADLQARGVRLLPDGAMLHVEPVGRVTPAELEALRQFKAEVIALLTRAPIITTALNALTLCGVLGNNPSEHDTASVAFDVMAALLEIEREIQSGIIGQTPLLIRNVPLGMWLDLSDVARLLRAGKKKEKPA